MISIVLATYNGSRYLEEQLESIATQTIKPNEIIVIDDCSTDDTLKIIEKFKNKNKNNEIDINIFLNNDNIGPARAFAKGILESKGDLIFLCDQDDIWFENKVEEVVNIFKKNSQIDVLCTGYHLYDDKNKKVIQNSKDSGEIYEVPLSRVLKGNISPGCTAAFRGTLRDKAKQINENIFIHDWFYSIVGAATNGLYYYCKPLIYYRIHDNNTIGKNLSFRPKYTKERRIKSIEKHIQFYKELTKLEMFDNVNDSNEIKKQVSGLIETNNIRLSLLNNYIGYSSYIRNLRFLKSNMGIKLVVGDLLYARKKV